ncbi:MAG: hypothetical protein AAGJ10_06595 [Bacteroidota bacterium]
MGPSDLQTSIRVRPISTSADRKRFIDFQYTFYQDEPHWIAPLRLDVSKTLNPKKNAFFEHGDIQLFLAEDAGGQVVGRIAAIYNGEHLKKYDDGNGFFGFFECIDDEQVAAALFAEARDWLKTKGLTGMRGPVNPSMNDVSALLVDGFDREPAILMPYNKPYYERLVTANGLTRAMTTWAYYLHKKYVQIDKMRRGAKIVRRRNPSITLRTIDMGRYDQETRTILDIYNEAWSNNWGHVAMTPGEFAQLAADMKQVIDPRIVYILEDNGTPIAFSISLPNLNQALRQNRNGALLKAVPRLLLQPKFGGVYEIRMPLMGVRQAYHGKALDTLMVLETIEKGPSYGYDACEMSWVLDSNKVLINSLESMGGVVDKEYALYEERFVS